MKAAFVENLNDIPYMMAEQWQTMGHDARLVARGRGLMVPSYSIPGAHGIPAPLPGWVTMVDAASRSAYNRAFSWLRIRRAAERLKMPIIVSGGTAMAFYKSKARMAIWCHGRELLVMPFKDPLYGTLTRRTMRAAIGQAELIISNQPDHAEAIRRLGIAHKTVYVNTPISCAFWRPSGRLAPRAAPPDSHFRVTAMAALDFRLKGTDRIIKGFAKFAAGCPKKAMLVLRDFGPDAQRCRDLARDLGIEASVVFRKEMPTEDQPADLERSHCIIDSVARGIVGMIGLEAMAMNRPLICHAPRAHYERHYDVGEMPPLFEARTDDEIARQLQAVSEGVASGAAGRDWVLKYHDAPVVARQLLEVTRRFTGASR